jgi:hypothetical protein
VSVPVAVGMAFGRSASTGVMPCCLLASRSSLRLSPAARSRGLMNSSMPKFSITRARMSRAMARPGGAHHHQAPLDVIASLDCA